MPGNGYRGEKSAQQSYVIGEDVCGGLELRRVDWIKKNARCRSECKDFSSGAPFLYGWDGRWTFVRISILKRCSTACGLGGCYDCVHMRPGPLRHCCAQKSSDLRAEGGRSLYAFNCCAYK